MDTRAYTRISTARTVCGNSWIERGFNWLLGRTESLRTPRLTHPREWLSRGAPDLAFERAGIVVRAEGVGLIAWSDGADAYGASLTSEFAQGGLVVRVTHVALHDEPAILRRVVLRNTGQEVCTLRHLASDALAVSSAHMRVYGDDGNALGRRFAGTRDSEQLVLLHAPAGAEDSPGARPQGLVLGREGGGLFTCFTPDRDVCSLRHPEALVVHPGEERVLPETWVLHFEGGFERAQHLIARLHRAREDYRRWREHRDSRIERLL